MTPAHENPAIVSESGLARPTDHTSLNPEATVEEIFGLCDEAKTHRFASACIKPAYVPLCSKPLCGIEVNVCAVIGFPFGGTSSVAKAQETAQVIRDSAQEVDLLVNRGMPASGERE